MAERKHSTRRLSFSSESVAAMFAGTKTITRRVIKPQPAHPVFVLEFLPWTPTSGESCGSKRCGICHPKYAVGDRLLVSERHRFEVHPAGPVVRYVGGAKQIAAGQSWKPTDGKRWVPPHLMPKWASRIELEVTASRAERLHAITTNDIIAEGILVPDVCYFNDKRGFAWESFERDCYATKKFAALWDQLNAKRGFAWESNPYVNVIGFRIAERHDALRAA